ncbi:MAG: hypothetical protein FD187_1767 [bacterium]|nr:MAG: hypothetical protein FD142_732 [bacterium]KAF0148721.1 MAG: hypothetical protein FD187_1767 [bacterium]KAF0168211.1 MAG: hypothetical protein FD158_1604 [bacterium]TXT18734.1 MAG: hypothetical protein FD132_2008 [bacterium]
MKNQRQSAAPDTPPNDEKLAKSGGGYIPPESQIGERIRKRRAEIGDGLGIEDLSRLCKSYDPEGKGVSRATIFRYEAGQGLPGARELRILCDALDMSANELLLGAESKAMHSKTSALAMLLEEWVTTMASEAEHRGILRGKKSGDMVRHELIYKAKHPPKT